MRLGDILRPLPLCLSFLALGIGFFVPTDVLFSIWFLYLLIKIVEEGILEKLGLSIGYGGMFVWGNADIAWQSFGAFLILIFSTIFSARHHLYHIVKEALKGQTNSQDPSQPMSYRFALIISTLCSLFIILWLWHSGMPFIVIILFIPTVFLLYLGLARVVCQSGIFYVVPPVIAQNLCIYTFGSRFIGPQGMVSL